MRFETRRLVIRSFTLDDVAGYAQLVSDPQVMKYLGDGSIHDKAQARAYIENCITNERTIGFARYALELAGSHKLIGFCGNAVTDDYIDFGYRLAHRHWGKGYVVEAAPMVIRHGFEQHKFDHIVAIAYEANTRSVRVIEKLGFEFERSVVLNDHTALRYRMNKPAPFPFSPSTFKVGS